MRCLSIADAVCLNNGPLPLFAQLMDGDKCIGCIVCKLEYHKSSYRGYIAMLAVKKEYRGRNLGSLLVVTAIRAMQLENCDEVWPTQY